MNIIFDFAKKNKIRIFALQMKDATTYNMGTTNVFSPVPFRPRRPLRVHFYV
jgi:hypothetical protein